MVKTPVGEWPPPAEEIWLVHGTMGAPIAAPNEDGVLKAVLLRVAARRNKGTEQLDTTLLLDLETVAEVMAGLISVANVAFGRAAVQDAMAKAIGLNDQEVAAAKVRLKEDL